MAQRQKKQHKLFFPWISFTLSTAVTVAIMLLSSGQKASSKNQTYHGFGRPLSMQLIQGKLHSIAIKNSNKTANILASSNLFNRPIHAPEVEIFVIIPPVIAPDILLKNAVTIAPLVAQMPPVLPTEKIAEVEPLKLTLKEAIALALEHNRDLKQAHLKRILDQQDLAIAKDQFVPNFTPSLAVDWSQNQTGNTISENADFNLDATVDVALPTGGNVGVTWRGTGQLDRDTEKNLGQNLSLNLTQPLWQDRGWKINRIPLVTANINEQINQINYRATQNSTIQSVMQAYRSLIQAQNSLESEQLFMDNARKDLLRTEALVKAGRLARVQLVQSQSTVANQEVSLISTKNALEDAQNTLLQAIDLPEKRPVEAIEIPDVASLKPIDLPPLPTLLQFAYDNNPNYVTSQFGLTIAQMDLEQAKNSQKWRVDLNLGYGATGNSLTASSNSTTAGLSVKRDFGNLSIEQAVNRSQINLEQLNYQLAEEKENLEVTLKTLVRDIQNSFQQVILARRAKELEIQRVEDERKQYSLGIGGLSLQDIVDSEARLVGVKNQELNAAIAYLNAITQLKELLGLSLLDDNNELILKKP